MSGDVRIQDLDFYQVSVNFDNFTNPKKSTPYRSTEDDTTDGTNQIIKRGLYYGSKLYGLGRVSSVSNVTKIYEKSSNIITDAWTASTSGNDASGTTESACFIQYQGFLFGFANGTRIWAYNVAAPAFTATALSVTGYTNPAQGIVTGDDLLLIPYDNKIAVKDGGSDATSNWETARLTLPSTLKIMDIEEWGDQVAIVCAPVTAENTHSYLYIWNKVDADIQIRVDLGEGLAQLVGDVDGELCIVMLVGTTNGFKGKLVVKRFLGGVATQIVKEIEADDTSITLPRTTKVKDQNRLTFACKMTLDGVTYYPQWVIGRKQEGYPLILSMDRLINNDTAATTIDGAWKVGQYWWWAINTGTVIRTNNDSAYTGTSIYISQKIPSGTRDATLKFVAMTLPALPAGSTNSLYYRVNEATSWTKIFDITTANTMERQAGIDASGADFSTFKEIQFKVTTTGGTALPAEWLTVEGEYEDVGADIQS